jgi:hypothetical protein
VCSWNWIFIRIIFFVKLKEQIAGSRITAKGLSPETGQAGIPVVWGDMGIYSE